MGEQKLKLAGIVVSEDSYKSNDEYEIIYSNIEYLESLFKENINLEEVSDDALKSYYVDYYLGQLNNGGFSQFVDNSDWSNEIIQYVRQGLKEIGASKNLELFEESAAIINRLGVKRVEDYLNGEDFGMNQERRILNSFDAKFYDLQKSESLISLNSKWLKQHEHLEVLNNQDYQDRLKTIIQLIPDKNLRAQKALEAEPRYKKLIRALCKHSGHTLEVVTFGDPTFKYKGGQVLAWNFYTNFGRHYMIDHDGEAIMFNGSDEIVTIIEAGRQYGAK